MKIIFVNIFDISRDKVFLFLRLEIRKFFTACAMVVAGCQSVNVTRNNHRNRKKHWKANTNRNYV